jgi:multiple sugar transport system substrate-binding protein
MSTEAQGRVEIWFLNQFRFDSDIGGDVVKEVQQQHPKLQLVPAEITGDRVQKLQTAAAAGSAPDIGQAGSWQMQEMGAAGIAAPLDQYLKASRVVKQADIWPGIVRDLTWKGQQYGMPFGPDIALLFVQSGALRAAGLNPDAPALTWNDLQQHATRLYRPEPFRLGFHPLEGQGGPRTWLVAMWQLGGEPLSPDGMRVTLNNDFGIKAIEWAQNLAQAQGGLDAIRAGLQPAGGLVGGFVNGVVGYMYETLDMPVRDPFKNAPGLQFSQASLPLPPGGKKVAIGGCHSFCITSQSKSPEGAWRFLETLSNDANNLKFAQRYNRIPIRVASARGAAFHQNNALLKLAVDEMANRRFWIPVPGGTEMLSIYSATATNVLTGKQAVRDALADTERQLQVVLDKWKR